MRIACPVWMDRVSPVFDDALALVLIDMEGGSEVSRRTVVLEDPVPVRRALKLTDLGVDVLICGAISRSLERMVAARGVKIIQRICGSADEVIGAFLQGDEIENRYSMPGACRRDGGQRRRRRQMKSINR